MTEMTLREVCRTIDVSRRAVQGYEKVKLVSATGKTESGHLLYNDSAVCRIKRIKLFQDMGFTIKEIQTIIDSPAEILKPALLTRKEKLNKDIQHRKAMITIIEEMLKNI